MITSMNNAIDIDDFSSKVGAQKRKINKISKVCKVCGDWSKSLHFGGQCCDSCKSFFRRSVHGDTYVTFKCSKQESCDISIATRKACQYCRFNKCLKIGMEKKWVMSEEERKALNDQRAKVKLLQEKKCSDSLSQVDFSSNSKENFNWNSESEPNLYNRITVYEPKVEDMLNYMSPDERNEIESIVQKYQQSHQEVPFNVPNTPGPRESFEIIFLFTNSIRRFIHFCKKLDDFNCLNSSDQTNLLKSSILEMCLLRSAISFDLDNNRWPDASIEFLKNSPRVQVSDLKKLVSSRIYEKHLAFITSIRKLQVDEPIINLLLLIVLFSSDRIKCKDGSKINYSQNKYTLLLEKYLSWRFGNKLKKYVFPRLLTKLTCLRELHEIHTESKLKLEKKDMDVVQEQLFHLNLKNHSQLIPKIIPLNEDEESWMVLKSQNSTMLDQHQVKIGNNNERKRKKYHHLQSQTNKNSAKKNLDKSMENHHFEDQSDDMTAEKEVNSCLMNASWLQREISRNERVENSLAFSTHSNICDFEISKCGGETLYDFPKESIVSSGYLTKGELFIPTASSHLINAEVYSDETHWIGKEKLNLQEKTVAPERHEYCPPPAFRDNYKGECTMSKDGKVESKKIEHYANHINVRESISDSSVTRTKSGLYFDSAMVLHPSTTCEEPNVVVTSDSATIPRQDTETDAIAGGDYFLSSGSSSPISSSRQDNISISQNFF